ncbi:PPOX class F420-dependent oxidoreductase [Pseudonocardia endophytica]|uniref:PPOX class probable F420-dependent enzyme n=1 Tax=Pseudonocardia endophytica TaxID=401976 RepID=A0A4R1HXZ6_PSEEN|nr:PPOX class F420-dependent oxidoreductase [Pseudonocardia endophytica]TCK24949.1 PPOX class probable F420-dependent enzyme [Pseudonocardia endophytica]
MPRTIATNTSVGRDELTEFLRHRHHMVLLTTRSDGGVQGSPVTGGVDDDGRIVIATYPERAKARNVARAGRGSAAGGAGTAQASVVVLSDEFNGAWVQVDGDAELLTLPDALEPLVDYFRAISGEHSDWDEYRQAMRDQGKALIRITPTRWSPIATGGFPPRLADT